MYVKRKSKMTLSSLISNIETAHSTFQAKALQSVSVNLTLRNFAQKLSYIKRMSKSNLKSFRQFYLAYPQISQSVTDQSLHVPIDKLLRTCTFTHFIELIKIDDENLFVSKYKVVLPTIKELEKLVKDDLEELE